MAGSPGSHTVVAHNADTESENRIHDDSVARRHGFGGGLVPGVTLYAYMAHVPAALWGREWIERGTMAARFLKPVYDGERVEAVGEPVGGAGEGAPAAVTLRLVGPDGETRATGRASLPEAPRGLPAPGTADPPGGATGADLIDDPTERPLPRRPGDRPPADERSLAPGTVLGTVVGHYRAPAAPAFLEEIHEDLALFSDGAVAHPGWLIRFANAAMASNVSLGPWIHVESEAAHLGAVTDGAELRFRSRVSEEYERHGHRYALLDGLLVTTTGAGAPEPVACPVMHVHHRVIYRLRG